MVEFGAALCRCPVGVGAAARQVDPAGRKFRYPPAAHRENRRERTASYAQHGKCGGFAAPPICLTCGVEVHRYAIGHRQRKPRQRTEETDNRNRKHSNRPAFHASSVAQQTHQGNQLAESTCSRGLRRTLFRPRVASGVGACGIAHSKEPPAQALVDLALVDCGTRIRCRLMMPCCGRSPICSGGGFSPRRVWRKAYGTLSDQIGYDTVRGNASRPG